MSGNDYIDLFFGCDRFLDIAELVLSHLDYFSFIRFKQTCHTVFHFLSSQPHLEQSLLRAKLKSDWRSNVPVKVTIETKGLVSCAKFFGHGRRLICAVEHSLRVFDLALPPTSSLEMVLTGAHVMPITSVEVVVAAGQPNDLMFVSGCRGGIMAVWSRQGECLVTKQLFGKIQNIVWTNEFLVTAHAGKSFEAGCVTVRLVKSPTEMPVVFSLYEDMFPVIHADLSPSHLAVLEWTGTLNGIEGGTINIYRWCEKTPIASLTHKATSSYTAFCFIQHDHILTGSHDSQLRLWSLSQHQIQCIHVLKDVHETIITGITWHSGRVVTTDLSRKILIWETDGLLDEEPQAVRQISPISKTLTSLCLDQRHLFMGGIGSLQVLSFWTDQLVPHQSE